MGDSGLRALIRNPERRTKTPTTSRRVVSVWISVRSILGGPSLIPRNADFAPRDEKFIPFACLPGGCFGPALGAPATAPVYCLRPLDVRGFDKFGQNQRNPRPIDFRVSGLQSDFAPRAKYESGEPALTNALERNPSPEIQTSFSVR